MTKADIWVRALATTLAKKGIENGKGVTYTDAEVWVTLATEYAYRQISLGYYYYPSDQKQTPESLSTTCRERITAQKYTFPNTPAPYWLISHSLEQKPMPTSLTRTEIILLHSKFPFRPSQIPSTAKSLCLPQKAKRLMKSFPTSNRGQQATVRIHKTGICIANKGPNESLRLDSL